MKTQRSAGASPHERTGEQDHKVGAWRRTTVDSAPMRAPLVSPMSTYLSTPCCYHRTNENVAIRRQGYLHILRTRRTSGPLFGSS